jgi:hypothetical protein
MLAHRGFSAWLVSDGGVIQEHLVAVDKENHRVSAWVSGQPGQVSHHHGVSVRILKNTQSFAVYWRDHGSKVDTCAYITLDGFVVPGRFLFGNGIAWRQSVRTGLATQRPFVFAKVEATGPYIPSQSSYPDFLMPFKDTRALRNPLRKTWA